MTTATTETYAYVGIAPCGCIRAATIDNPNHAKDVRKDVQSFMRHGDTIERVPVETVRREFCLDKHPKRICPHPQACPHRAKTEAP